MSKPLVSIITVNYNGLLHTQAFLDAMRRQSYTPIEIIVVDNASVDDASLLKVIYPEITLIKSEKNVGFAGGNNLGVAKAKGDYILFLNNDTEPAPDFLTPLVDLMENNPKIGAVSSKLLYYDEPQRLQFAGGTGINLYTGRGFAIGYKELDSAQYTKNYQTKSIHGAACMVSRAVIEKVGNMSELFFLYYEETDYCERIMRAGFEVWYCGASKVLHKESMATGKDSPLKIYYLTRNRLVFVRRNALGFQKLIALLFFWLVALPKGLLNYLFKAQFQLALAMLKGACWNLIHFDIYKDLDIKAE